MVDHVTTASAMYMVGGPPRPQSFSKPPMRVASQHDDSFESHDNVSGNQQDPRENESAEEGYNQMASFHSMPKDKMNMDRGYFQDLDDDADVADDMHEAQYGATHGLDLSIINNEELDGYFNTAVQTQGEISQDDESIDDSPSKEISTINVEAAASK